MMDPGAGAADIRSRFAEARNALDMAVTRHQRA